MHVFILVFWVVLQHRMSPEIACLLTPHIYSELENHPSVLDYDNIKVCIVLTLLLSPALMKSNCIVS